MNYKGNHDLRPYNVMNWRNTMPRNQPPHTFIPNSRMASHNQMLQQPYMQMPHNQIIPRNIPNLMMRPNYMPHNNIPSHFLPNIRPHNRFNFHPNYYNDSNNMTPHTPILQNEEMCNQKLFQHTSVEPIIRVSNNSFDSVSQQNDYIVTNFLRKIPKFTSTQTNQDRKVGYLRICEAKKLKERAKELTQELKKMIEKLPENIEATKRIQEELKPILETLSNKKVVEDLRKKIKYRRKKRSRQKIQRQINHERQLLNEQNRKNLDLEISNWQVLEKSKLEKKLRDKAQQKQLDESLSGLRKEQNMLKTCTEIICFIHQLRNARLHLSKNGQNVILPDTTNDFNSSVSFVNKTLSAHRKTIKRKISSLTLLIECEQLEVNENLEKVNLKKKQDKKDKWEYERKCILFGKEANMDPFHPLWPVQALHRQAEEKFENLRQYRIMWDQYINKEGTSVPYNYVEPVIPSSKSWESFIEH